MPFGDSGKAPVRFELRIEDCLKAIERAQNKGWINTYNFNTEHYDKLSKLDEGDLNWIIPGKLVAGSSPAINLNEGLPPRFYNPILKESKVNAIIRLNEKLYNDENFENKGFRIYPMEFADGTTPSNIHMIDFTKILQNEIDMR